MNQKYIVHNKTQLLAAVGCAFDYFGKTEIILNRKNGTTKMSFSPDTPPHKNSTWFHSYIDDCDKAITYNRAIKKVLTNIRQTPAECFK